MLKQKGLRLENNLDMARATLYGFFASLYINGGIERDYEPIIKVLEVISTEPFTDEAKGFVDSMIKRLKDDKEGVKYEFEVLFNLPFGDFINSSASYYHDERELGEKTILAKEIMHEAGYIKADFFSSGEDEFGMLCAVCSKLILEQKMSLQKRVFDSIIKPTVANFVDAQLLSGRAEFYKDAASLFALFVTFEKSYFEFYV